MTSFPTVVVGRLSEGRAGALLRAGEQAEPSYGPVGLLLTADEADLDLSVEQVVGVGQDAFAAAVASFRSLDPQRAVATVWPAGAVAVEGATVLIGLPFGPVTVVALNRVLAVVERPRRWGFAYATLPGHAEVGEEAFVVEHRADDTVVARITAKAHVALPLAKWIQPLLVPVQRRFAGRYLDAVQAGVVRSSAAPA